MGAVTRLLAALALALGLLVPAAGQGMPTLASGPGERILSFDADIVVADTGDLHVVETIRVRVRGEQIQRGIIRTLPVATGASPYTILSVTRDGKDEPFTTSASGGAMVVRIGSSDVLLTPGDVTYQITYKASDQLKTAGGTRTLFWNVTGNDWVFGIDSASATVHLPGGAQATSLKLFTGPRGSTAGDGTIEQIAPGTATARIGMPLQPGSGLTILVEWAVAAASPNPRRTVDGLIRFYTIARHVFVIPLVVLVL